MRSIHGPVGGSLLLRSLTLKNFRCFGPEPKTIEFDRFTTLIGANSTGKTTVLHALKKLLSPVAAERIIEPSDFHVPKDERVHAPERSLLIEARIDLPELSAHEMSAATRHRVPPFFHHLCIGESDSPHLRIRLTAELSFNAGPDGDVEQKTIFVPPSEEKGSEPRVENSHRRHIQFLYIPALRDPTSQLRHHAGTLKWRLMQAVAWSDEVKQSIEDAAAEAQRTFDKEAGYQTVLKALRESWVAFHDDDRYRDVDFRVAESSIDALISKAELVFRPSPDGFSRDADAIGDGLRSLAYFSLVCALLKVELQLENDAGRATAGLSTDYLPPSLTIVAAEEPENHLAPHLLGRALRKLQSTAEQPNAQVVVTSHTASALKRIEPERIRYLRLLEGQRTDVSPIRLPNEARENVYKYVREAVRAHPELYFAKLVVLGEGESEEVVLTKLLEVCHRPVDMAQISIVPLGGRHVNHLWRLLSGLKIPHITLLDLDRGRFGGGWGRVRYAVKQLYFLEHPEKRDTDAYEAHINVKVRGEVVTITKDDLDEYSRSEKFVKRAELDACVAMLEKEHNIYFSYPLDLDFMMLKRFPEYYKDSFPEGRGQQIPQEGPSYRRKLKTAEKSVLKTRGTPAGYTSTDKELFIYYDYLFLGRGKPTTHMIALSEIPEDELRTNLPRPLMSLIGRVNDLLGGSPRRDRE